jgi:hypothetical protein
MTNRPYITRFGLPGVDHVMHAHHCALERLDAYWQVFAVPQGFWGFESKL